MLQRFPAGVVRQQCDAETSKGCRSNGREVRTANTWLMKKRM